MQNQRDATMAQARTDKNRTQEGEKEPSEKVFPKFDEQSKSYFPGARNNRFPARIVGREIRQDKLHQKEEGVRGDEE